MSILKRIFNMGRAKAHSVADEFENQMELTSLAMRDTRKQITEAKTDYAKSRAASISAQKKVESAQTKVEVWQEKIQQLVTLGKSGKIPMDEAKAQATTSVQSKKKATDELQDATKVYGVYKNNADKFQKVVARLEKTYDETERKFKTLETRKDMSEAQLRSQEQFSKYNDAGMVSMLEKIDESITSQESLIEANTHIEDASKSEEDLVNETLARANEVSAESEVDDLFSEAKPSEPTPAAK